MIRTLREINLERARISAQILDLYKKVGEEVLMANILFAGFPKDIDKYQDKLKELQDRDFELQFEEGLNGKE